MKIDFEEKLSAKSHVFVHLSAMNQMLVINTRSCPVLSCLNLVIVSHKTLPMCLGNPRSMLINTHIKVPTFSNFISECS